MPLSLAGLRSRQSFSQSASLHPTPFICGQWPPGFAHHSVSPVHGRTGPQRRPPPFAAATFQPIGLPLRRRPLPACSVQSDSAWLPAIQWTCSLWVRSQPSCSELRLVARSYGAIWQPWEVMCDGVQFLDCGLQMHFDVRFPS